MLNTENNNTEHSAAPDTNMSHITVIDAIMGSGKTSWAIQYMNNTPSHFLYITPFLSEIDRIKSSVHKPFYSPANRGKGKLENLNTLLMGNENIAATHELFKHVDNDTKMYLKAGHYVLILDEVLDVLEPIKMRKGDLKILQQSECISIDEKCYVNWNPDKTDYDTRYNDLKALAQAHCLICVNENILLWQYPPEVFQLFDQIYIMTYMFEASILKYFFELFDIPYQKRSITHTTDLIQHDKKYYSLCDYTRPDTMQYRNKIHVYMGTLNYNFLPEYQRLSNYSLSKSWFSSAQDEESSEIMDQLQKNIENYFRNVRNSKTKENMWTTFKDYASKLKGKGYTRGFVNCSSRSTNDYQEKKCLAYCLNLYFHPGIMAYLIKNQIYPNQDSYALSQMLQWIWRSAIRNGEEIWIYVPSRRMRRLLYEWMGLEWNERKM